MSRKNSHSAADASLWPGEAVQQSRLEDRVRVVFAAVITVVCHFLLVGWVAAMDWQPETTAVAEPEEDSYVIELVEPEPEPDRFVEVNPDVLPEEPEETTHIAAMDQVAAQPEPSEDKEEGAIPDVNGAVESQRILDGDLQEPIPPPQPWGQPERPQVQADVSVPEQVDFSTQEEGGQAGSEILPVEADQDEGLLAAPEVTEDEEPAADPEPVTEPRRDPGRPLPSVEVYEEAPSVSVPEGQPVPQPRPRLTPRTTPGPVMRSPTQASRMGQLAIDARFSEFGAYQQRMIEAISYQWNLLGRNFNFVSGDRGTQVQVVFMLHDDGNISDFKVLSTTASRAATFLVQDAVLSPAPYGHWTEDMVRVLGDSQQIRITFFYQ